MMWTVRVAFWLFVSCLASCASPWKIHGGPKECTQICQRWGMELVGMVGVGNQDETGAGATACVCEIAGKGRTARSGESGIAANSAAVITAIQEEERRAASAQQAAGALPR